jgi:hypothetical protein
MRSKKTVIVGSGFLPGSPAPYFLKFCFEMNSSLPDFMPVSVFWLVPFQQGLETGVFLPVGLALFIPISGFLVRVFACWQILAGCRVLPVPPGKRWLSTKFAPLFLPPTVQIGFNYDFLAPLPICCCYRLFAVRVGLLDLAEPVGGGCSCSFVPSPPASPPSPFPLFRAGCAK